MKPVFCGGLRFVLAYSIALSFLFFVCLELNIPTTFPVVLISGLAPLIIHALPYFVMKIDPQLLLDYEKYRPPRENVRNHYEFSSLKFENKEIELLYKKSLFTYKSASNVLIISCCLSVLSLLVIADVHGLGCYFPLLLSFCFALISRTIASSTQKNVSLLTSAVLILEFFLFADCPTIDKIVAGVVILSVAVLLNVVAAFVKDDSYSIVLSRFGDAVQFLMLVSLIPYGFVTGGLVEVFRNGVG